MKLFTSVVTKMLLLSFINQTIEASMEEKNAFSFSFKMLISDELIPLKQFEGEVIMVVNTASNCGFTSQYAALEKLYNAYKDKGFVVIGVPSNDFGNQEQGTNEEISHFCKVNYGVTFPMASKEVVSGSAAHPFYLWAKETLGFGTAPKWNFHKYLINRNGKLLDYFNSFTSPDSDRVKEAIEKALAEK